MWKTIYCLFLSLLSFASQSQVIKSFGLNVGTAFGTTDITYSSGETTRMLNYASESVSTFVEFISHENINLGIVAGLINIDGYSNEIRLDKPREGDYFLSQNYVGARIKGRIMVSNTVKVFAIVEPYFTIYRGLSGGELDVFYNYNSPPRFGAAYGVGIEQDMKRISLSYNILMQQLFKDDYNRKIDDFYIYNIERIDVKSVVARIDIKYKLFLPKKS